jgi:hypothetical protein
MVAAAPDGEDSAGRAKLRLATPEELVQRAFVTANLAYWNARQRGLILNLPDLKDTQAEAKDRREAEAKVKEDGKKNKV